MEWYLAILGTIAFVGWIVDTVNDNKTDQENLEIAQAQLQLQKENSYNSAKATLEGYNNELLNLESSTIPDIQANIDNPECKSWTCGTRTMLEQVGGKELEINTYDDYLSNWQQSYDLQTKSAKAQGADNLTSLLSNWSDAEVMAADRGMGGSMNLIANQEKQKAVDYAGSDLSLAGSDGLYGMDFANLTLGLNTAKRQAQDQRDILGIGLDNLKTSFANEKTGWETQLGIETDALSRYTAAKDTLKTNIADQTTTVEKLKLEAGL